MPEQAVQIYVFTAGDSEARAHLKDSITQALDLQRVLAHFPQDLHAQIRALHDEDGLYAWGAIPGVQNTPRWESMKPGDWALCVYENTYHFAAQVRAKFDNEAFAKDVWGTDPNGRTWNLMYFLSRPVAIDIRVSDLADFLNQGYMGFSRIGTERLGLIETTYGSVGAFIEQRILNAPSTASSHPFDAITRADVLDALQRIDAGEMHGFGPSTDYDLKLGDKRYPPKAAAGIATIRTLGRAMRPDEFTAGIGSKNFRTLEKLGFEIVPKATDAPQAYFLIRSNPESPYQDELGQQYH